jgi:creatinine amidohydrolase
VDLGDLTSTKVGELLQGSRPCVALVPVGSVEPHGPHLPLSTDTMIGAKAIDFAAQALLDRDVVALAGPPVGYGVTDFAQGFPGAVSIPARALAAFVGAVAGGYLEAGFAHVCLVNNHLEPAHDAALREAIQGLPQGRASVASPLERRFGRTLSDEFKSGACHAGRYETSLVLVARPDLVDAAAMSELPPLSTSLSEGIKAGRKSFREMGLDRAYTGAPGEATLAEGNELYQKLSQMIVTLVLEGLAAAPRKDEP